MSLLSNRISRISGHTTIKNSGSQLSFKASPLPNLTYSHKIKDINTCSSCLLSSNQSRPPATPSESINTLHRYRSTLTTKSIKRSRSLKSLNPKINRKYLRQARLSISILESTRLERAPFRRLLRTGMIIRRVSQRHSSMSLASSS